MSFPGVPAAFGNFFDREGDNLRNQVDVKIFIDDPGPRRVIVIVVYNHLASDLFHIGHSVDAGGFTPDFGPPEQIKGKSAGGYRVQSSDGETALKVTVNYGLSLDSPESALFVICDPEGGGFTAGSRNGFSTVSAGLPGDHRQLDVDLGP